MAINGSMGVSPYANTGGMPLIMGGRPQLPMAAQPPMANSGGGGGMLSQLMALQHPGMVSPQAAMSPQQFAPVSPQHAPISPQAAMGNIGRPTGRLDQSSGWIPQGGFTPPTQSGTPPNIMAVLQQLMASHPAFQGNQVGPNTMTAPPAGQQIQNTIGQANSYGRPPDIRSVSATGGGQQGGVPGLIAALGGGVPQGQQQQQAAPQSANMNPNAAPGPNMRWDSSSGWIPNDPAAYMAMLAQRVGGSTPMAAGGQHPGMRYDQSSGWLPA